RQSGRRRRHSGDGSIHGRAGCARHCGGVLDVTVILRETAETKIRVEVARGTRAAARDTRLPFFNHMLATLAQYSGLRLPIRAYGDLRQHLMEDVAIAVGAGVVKVMPATAVRYAHRFVPMDDALVHAAIDGGGRPYYRGRLPNKLYEHWMRSFCDN